LSRRIIAAITAGDAAYYYFFIDFRWCRDADCPLFSSSLFSSSDGIIATLFRLIILRLLSPADADIDAATLLPPPFTPITPYYYHYIILRHYDALLLFRHYRHYDAIEIPPSFRRYDIRHYFTIIDDAIAITPYDYAFHYDTLIYLMPPLSLLITHYYWHYAAAAFSLHCHYAAYA